MSQIEIDPNAPEMAEGEIGPLGGTVDLPGVARITFPTGVLPRQDRVSGEIVYDPQTSEMLDAFRSQYSVTTTAAYQVRIRAYSQPTDDVTIGWQPSTELLNALGADNELIALAWMPQEGDFDEGDVLVPLEVVPSTAARAVGSLASLPLPYIIDYPPQAFRSLGLQQFEALLTVGIRSKVVEIQPPQHPAPPDGCGGPIGLISPLEQFTPTGCFGDRIRCFGSSTACLCNGSPDSCDAGYSSDVRMCSVPISESRCPMAFDDWGVPGATCRRREVHRRGRRHHQRLEQPSQAVRIRIGRSDVSKSAGNDLHRDVPFSEG